MWVTLAACLSAVLAVAFVACACPRITVGSNTGYTLMAFAFPLAMLSLYLAFYLHVVNKAMRRCIERLEQLGELENAAAQFDAFNKTVVGPNKVIITPNFIFGHRNGAVVCIRDVVWAYKAMTRGARYGGGFEGVFLCTRTLGKLIAAEKNAASDGDWLDQIVDSVRKSNPDALIGFSQSKQDLYDQLLRLNEEK